jgi:hypothetical protein
MGQHEQKLILCRGASAWNQWRSEHPEAIPDLSFCVLEGADLTGADLSKVDLYCAWLEGANLAGANLNGADLNGANLAGADLSDADLSGGLYLTQAQICQAKGNKGTRLPQGLVHPERWLQNNGAR